MDKINDLQPRTFTAFNELSDEIILNILGFTADAPFEQVELGTECTLLHVFPFVNKRIHNLIRGISSIDIWRDVIIRRCNAEAGLWIKGILHLIKNLTNQKTLIDYDGKTIHIDELIDEACSLFSNTLNSFSASEPYETCAAELVYRYIVRNYLRFWSPVFVMPGEAFIGEDIQLHFFEPRYRLLIREVMRGHLSNIYDDDIERENDPENHHDRSFVYACHGSIARSSPACLVKIKRCHIYPDGRADVVLRPTAHLWVLNARERPNSGALFDCQVVRMGQSSSESIMKRMLRQRRYWIHAGDDDESIHAIMAFLNNYRPPADADPDSVE